MDDEKFQMVTSIKPSANALLMDAWDIMIAAHMIVLGYSRDVSLNIEQGLNYPRGHACNEYSMAVLFAIDKFIELAEMAIAIGKVKAIDTPVNWIKWAQNKGFNTDHLDPEHHIKQLEFILQDYEDRPDISPLPVPEILEAHKKNLSKWQLPYLTTRTTVPQAEALADTGAGSLADTEPAGARVCSIFSEFSNLRSNEVSLVMMNDETAKIVVRGKTIKVCPDDLCLKIDSKGWKLLEGAAVRQGDLTSILKTLNSSIDLEAEKGKIKTTVSRLRRSLIDRMGLIDNPISYTTNSGYKFAFKTMTHELLNGCNVTKGADAMDYLDDESLDESRSFWSDDDTN